MMESGTITVQFYGDGGGAGGLQASVTFTPGGSSESYPLADGLPVGDGQSITIEPSCVECELQTTAQAGGGMEHRAAPAEEPKAARQPGPGHARAEGGGGSTRTEAGKRR